MEPLCKKMTINLVRIKVEDIKVEDIKVEEPQVTEQHDVEMKEEEDDDRGARKPLIRVMEEDGTDIGFLIPVRVQGSESPRQPVQCAAPSTVALPVKAEIKEEPWDRQVCADDVKLEPDQVKPEPEHVKPESEHVKPESMESCAGQQHSAPGIKEESEASSATTSDQQFWRKTQAAIDHEFSWDSETGCPVASGSRDDGPQRWAVEGSMLKPREKQQKRPQSQAGPRGKSKKARQEAALSPANRTLPAPQTKQREQRTNEATRLAVVMDALSRQMSRFACDVTDQFKSINNRLVAMENTLTSLEA